MEGCGCCGCCSDFFSALTLVLGAMNFIFDLIFAVEVGETHIACKQSCSVGQNFSGPVPANNYTANLRLQNDTHTCSNGFDCPSNPNFYLNLLIATLFFTAWYSCFVLYYMYLVLNEKTESFEGCRSVVDEEKQITVLHNGATLKSFRMYGGLLARSTVSTLECFENFDEKIQFLKEYKVLLPVYYFIHFLHFYFVSFNDSKCAKIFFPDDVRYDQELLTPRFQILDSPTGRAKIVPAIVIIQGTKDAQRRWELISGSYCRSLPQMTIQLIYLLSGTPSWRSIIAFLKHCLSQLYYHYKGVLLAYRDIEDNEKAANTYILRHFVSQGYAESELSIVMESIKSGGIALNTVVPAEGQ
jgi:hypothetical protein